jgi:hypothetical protein
VLVADREGCGVVAGGADVTTTAGAGVGTCCPAGAAAEELATAGAAGGGEAGGASRIDWRGEGEGLTGACGKGLAMGTPMSAKPGAAPLELLLLFAGSSATICAG